MVGVNERNDIVIFTGTQTAVLPEAFPHPAVVRHLQQTPSGGGKLTAIANAGWEDQHPRQCIISLLNCLLQAYTVST